MRLQIRPSTKKLALDGSYKFIYCFLFCWVENKFLMGFQEGERDFSNIVMTFISFMWITVPLYRSPPHSLSLLFVLFTSTASRALWNYGNRWADTLADNSADRNFYNRIIFSVLLVLRSVSRYIHFF